MSYTDRLNTEIDAKIDALEAQKRPLNATWIAHSICIDHEVGLAENDHREFWEHGGYSTTRKMVTTRVNKRRGDKPKRAPKQGTLRGFQHVQDYYVVERDGDELGVPAHTLTDDEIDRKIDLYRSMGAACYEHADELQRYKELRKAQVA